MQAAYKRPHTIKLRRRWYRPRKMRDIEFDDAERLARLDKQLADLHEGFLELAQRAREDRAEWDEKYGPEGFVIPSLVILTDDEPGAGGLQAGQGASRAQPS